MIRSANREIQSGNPEYLLVKTKNKWGRERKRRGMDAGRKERRKR